MAVIFGKKLVLGRIRQTEGLSEWHRYAFADSASHRPCCKGFTGMAVAQEARNYYCVATESLQVPN